MPAPSTRRVALLTAAVLTCLAGVAGCTGGNEADLGRPPASVAPGETRDSAAAELVDGIESALAPGVDPGAVATTDPRARGELEAAAANVRALRLRGVDLRYLAPSTTGLSEEEKGRFGPDAWVADVQVSWQQAGVDRRPALLTFPLVLAGRADEQSFATFAPADADRVPLWLLARLSVVRGPRSVAVATKATTARRLSVLAERAVETVRETLPGWKDTLLVQETPSQQAFQLAAGLPQQQARAVAAVTTTADGSADDGARGQVFVNPQLFDPLDQQGRQIVVSHESAHVALGAATTELPLWLSEGMADWVALRSSPLPVERLAGQVISWVEESGGPKGLPGAAAFDGSDKRIGAWYEAAWLAVKRIADTYGAPELLRFYREAARAGRTDQAFADVLGTSEAAFVRDWRGYLESLA